MYFKEILFQEYFKISKVDKHGSVAFDGIWNVVIIKLGTLAALSLSTFSTWFTEHKESECIWMALFKPRWIQASSM